MKTRTLGNSGIEVSVLGYGCMGLEASMHSAYVLAIDASSPGESALRTLPFTVR